MTSTVLNTLLASSLPWHGVAIDVEAVESAGRLIASEGGLFLSVSGREMRTVDDLFDRIGTAFEFPDYFGRNWAAFDECLSDLDWLPPASSYVLLIHQAARLLADEPPEQLRVLLGVLDKVSGEWASSIELGEWWDRPPRPFHVLFQEAEHPQVLQDRFRQAGFDLEWLSTPSFG